MKLAVLGALLEGRTTGPVTVHDRFPSAAGGEFTLLRADDQDDWTWDRLGQELDLSVLADRMVTVSGNLAADLVLERIGFDAVRRHLDGLGLGDLRVDRLIGDSAAQDEGITNTVTAAGLAELMVRLGSTPGAVSLLSRQTHLDMIPAGLPTGTWSASKGGWVTGVKNDVALVRPPATPPYVLAVCTTTDLSDPDGMNLVARLSAVTWEHWTRWHAS
jgi:beta-lactamase class A